MSAESKSGKFHVTDASQIRSWVVCESGTRWLTATRRFAVQMMPDHLIASIIPLQPTPGDFMKTCSLLTRKHPSILFWVITPQNLTTVIDLITQTSIGSRSVLQLAAVHEISQASQIALSETGIATQIQRPEQLPSLASMIRLHFQRAAA